MFWSFHKPEGLSALGKADRGCQCHVARGSWCSLPIAKFSAWMNNLGLHCATASPATQGEQGPCGVVLPEHVSSV